MTDPLATVLSNPLANAIDADMAEAIHAATADGTLRLIAYAPAGATLLASGWVADDKVASALRMWDRAGFPVGGEATVTLDFASRSAQEFWGDGRSAELLEAYEFAGIHVGGIDGTPGYDPPAEARGHVPHGGSYRTTGVRAMLADGGVMLADLHQEHLVGSVDLAGDADDHYPDHLMLAEEAILATGATDVAPHARHMSPPLWSIIYGQRATAGRLVAPMTTVPRAGNLYHPYQGYPGLAEGQANELQCFQVALLAVNGMTAVFQAVADHYAHRVQPDSAEPVVAFVAQVAQALTDREWTADALAYGRMELPLVQQSWSEFGGECGPECGPGTTLTGNPVLDASMALVQPGLLATAIPPGMVADAQAGADFLLPRVLHSVWTTTSGQVVVVLVNWTALASGGTIGTFCPWLYWADSGQVGHECGAEFALTATFGVDRINSDGTTTAIAADLTDAVNLLCSGTSGTIAGQDVSLGTVPAYSIQAYRLTKA